MSVCVVDDCSQFVLGSQDLVDKLVHLDVDQIRDPDVERVSVAYYVDQFIDVMCNQTYECLIPLVADILNLDVNISVDVINLVVNFRTIGNQIDNRVVNFTVVDYIVL